MTAKRLSTFFVIIYIIFLLIPQALAQKVKVQVDGQDIYELIDYMAADEYLGRKPLTPKFFELQEWAVNKFKEWGLDPAGDDGTFFGAATLGRRYAISKGTPELVIDGREFFIKFRDFSIDHRSNLKNKINRNIVFAGYGISSPEKGLDEYTGINVKDKLVLIFKGSPKDAKPIRRSTSPGKEKKDDDTEDWKTESKDKTKIMTAYEKGAAGIIFYNPDPNLKTRATPVEKSPFEREFIVVSNISEYVYKWILWRDPQESERGFNRRMNKIQLDIKQKEVRSFETSIQAEIKGFESTDLYGKKFDNYIGRNVIAKITGSDPVLKNEYVVLGGHFDHLGVQNNQVYNGADDNASGSAVVMEVARLMKKHSIKPKRTVIFCLWTGEELGLIGSWRWVKNPTDGVTMDKVVLNFNMDMVGLGAKINAPGALNFPSIWEVLKKHQDQDIIEAIEPSEGGPGGSDHTHFIKLGIESLALMTSGGSGHPDYHDTGDDTDKLDKEILRKTGQFVLQGTINAANEPGTLIIPDRQHIYDGMQWNITAINPELKIKGSWTTLDAKTKSELADLVIDHVKKLKKPTQTTTQRQSRRRSPRSQFNLGIAGPKVFGHNIDDLNIAHAALEFGRIDIHGDDGVWFDKGLTPSGREALSVLEDNRIVLNLFNPSIATFNEVLTSAKKPFLVSGISDFDSGQIELINDKNVLITVDFDPNQIEGCVVKLEALKSLFGDYNKLLLNLQSDEGLKSAKKDLYMRLIKKGWAKKEIYAISASGMGGNLRKLGL